jgi:hypothetical protein
MAAAVVLIAARRAIYWVEEVSRTSVSVMFAVGTMVSTWEDQVVRRASMIKARRRRLGLFGQARSRAQDRSDRPAIDSWRCLSPYRNKGEHLSGGNTLSA